MTDSYSADAPPTQRGIWRRRIDRPRDGRAAAGHPIATVRADPRAPPAVLYLVASKADPGHAMTRPPTSDDDALQRRLDAALDRVRRDGPTTRPFARVFDPDDEDTNRRLVAHIRRLLGEDQP